MASVEGERGAAKLFDLLPRPGDALLAAGHQRHGEALAGEAPGDRRPEARTYAKYSRDPTVQVALLSRAAQALPLGNS